MERHIEILQRVSLLKKSLEKYKEFVLSNMDNYIIIDQQDYFEIREIAKLCDIFPSVGYPNKYKMENLHLLMDIEKIIKHVEKIKKI